MEITLTGSAGSITIPEDEILDNPGIDITKTHTGVADFRIGIVGGLGVQDFVARQDQILVEVESGTEFIGYLTDIQTDYRDGNALISGYGIAKRLQETRPEYDNLGGSLTYSNIAVEDAIEDYWSRTPFDTVTVYPQDTETIATDEQLQSATTAPEWSDISSVPSDVPLEAAGGVLQTLKSCNTLDAENQPNSGVEVTNGDYNADFSGATAIELSGEAESVDFEVSVEYDISAFDLIYQFRVLENNLDTDVRIFFEGTEVTNFGVSGTSSLDWQYTGALNESDLSPGLYTVTIELDNYTSGQLVVDVGAFYDNQYEPPKFDNSTNSFGALEEPGEYPTSISTTFLDARAGFNVTEADVNLVEDSNEPINEIAVSFDDGSTFKTAANTLSATFNPNIPTRVVTVRLTLSGYTGNATTTPANRDTPHEIEQYDLLVDLNSLTVIDELDLSQDHFTNLQTLHDYGDYLWNIEHDDKDIANLTVESFERGTQSKTLPVDKKISQTSEVAAESYYNTIFLQGAKLEVGRPTAEKKNFDAIANDGREISPGVLRDLDIVTEAGAEFRAQSLLERAQLNNAVRGRQTYPADLSIQPGYAYGVDFQNIDGWGTSWGSDWGNEPPEFTLEELSLTYSGSEATIMLDFVPEQSLAEDITELRRASRQQSDRV